ncbi:hypothetical protein, partial [Delftia acidovorans]|uniref:hypothetical protein n=1 Tax=Delftia acidovorans TaxID=80866 RepID=UPI0035A1BA86
RSARRRSPGVMRPTHAPIAGISTATFFSSTERLRIPHALSLQEFDDWPIPSHRKSGIEF